MKNKRFVLANRFLNGFLGKVFFVLKAIFLVLIFALDAKAAEVFPDSTVDRLIAMNRYYIVLLPTDPRNYRTILPLIENYDRITGIKRKAEAAYILGHYYRAVFEGENSSKYFLEAAELYKQADEWGSYLKAKKTFCVLSAIQGNFNVVEPTLRKCFEEARMHPVGFYILAPLQEMMVHLSYAVGKPAEAVKYGHMFMDSLQKYERLGIENEDFERMRTVDARVVELELGHSYLVLGEWDKAEHHLRNAESFFLKRKDNEKLSRIYRHLAVLAGHQNRSDSVESHLNKFERYLIAHNKARTRVLFKLPRLTRDLQTLYLSNLEHEREMEHLKRRNYYFLALFALGIALALIVFWSQRKDRLNQKKINELLRRDFGRSQLLHEEKSRYFSILSHELRTPIFAITGLTKLLEDPVHNTKENVDAIINSGSHLLHLVNNVLQHTKLEQSSQVNLDEVNFELTQAFTEALQTTAYLAVQKNIEVQVNSDLNGPQYLYGDKQKLTQILVNLVSNAIRYSPRDTRVEVSVSQKDVNDTSGTFRFCIRDYGIGIDTSQIPLLFGYHKTTYDVKREGGGNNKGMGIGLFVVANFIRAMNSEVVVESEKGVGSSFSFDLVLRRGIDAQVPPQTKQRTQKSVNILVVDDMKINQLVTQKTLRSIGVNCVGATDMDPIVEIIRNNNIDLILMDLNMRLESGYEISRKIRKEGILIPIIAHTASMIENIDHTELAAAEIQDFLIKPYSIEDLKQKLTQYLNISF